MTCDCEDGILLEKALGESGALKKGEKNMSKMSTCKHCGAEIAANAKSCPQCGGKNKKPIYKRGWFIALCVIVVVAAVSSAGGEESTPAGGASGSEVPPVSVSTSAAASVPVEDEIVYTVCKVDDMMDMLNNNAMKAESTYDDQYVEVTGRLDVIDSDGKYISLFPIKDEWAFIGVQCYIKNDVQKQQVVEMSKGDRVTVRGKITSVGELLGYQLNIIEIVK